MSMVSDEENERARNPPKTFSTCFGSFSSVFEWTLIRQDRKWVSLSVGPGELYFCVLLCDFVKPIKAKCKTESALRCVGKFRGSCEWDQISRKWKLNCLKVVKTVTRRREVKTFVYSIFPSLTICIIAWLFVKHSSVKKLIYGVASHSQKRHSSRYLMVQVGINWRNSWPMCVGWKLD